MIAGALKESVMARFAINTDFIRKHTVQAVLTVLGLSGVVAVFLPFIDRYVAVEFFLGGLDWEDDELAGFLALLGSFVVLPFFISAGYLRWLFTARLSRWETWLGYALALIVVVLLSLSIIQAWWESGFDEEMLFMMSLALGLGAGAWFVIQNLRHGVPPTLTALVALQLGYVPFALFWLAIPIVALLEALPEWDFSVLADIGIGAYLAFLTVFVYTAQAALSVRGQPRLLLRLLPLGLVWVGGLTAGFLVWQ